MTSSPAPVAAQSPPVPASFGRFLFVLVVTLSVTAGGLRLADTLPAWWSGEPRSVRAYDTVDDLEREVRTRLLLPAFFPETLEWPPSRILRAAGPGMPTLVAFRDRPSGRERVILCQTLDGDAPIPARLLAPGTVLEERTVEVSGAPAALRVVRGAGDETWTELTWVQQSRRLLLRGGPGTTRTDLMRLARSLHRGRP
jgi:hypothetical protein